MAIAITYLERWDPRPRNSVTLFDRHGEIALSYAKVHTCEFDREAALTPGDGFPVAALDTRCGSVRVGAMICFDREFPESARLLMLSGAEIVLVPNACELGEHRLGQFRARAFENMIGLAMANYPTPQENGHSIAVHPITYGHDERPQSTTILEAGEDEGIFVAAFDLEAIREYRRRETWGDAYRRPRLYGALVTERAREPFVRDDATR
jgi:predicted amidohydrolase